MKSTFSLNRNFSSYSLRAQSSFSYIRDQLLGLIVDYFSKLKLRQKQLKSIVDYLKNLIISKFICTGFIPIIGLKAWLCSHDMLGMIKNWKRTRSQSILFFDKSIVFSLHNQTPRWGNKLLMAFLDSHWKNTILFFISSTLKQRSSSKISANGKVNELKMIRLPGTEEKFLFWGAIFWKRLKSHDVSMVFVFISLSSGLIMIVERCYVK